MTLEILDQSAVEAEDPSAAPVDDWGQMPVIRMEPREAVETFLKILGKNPATTYFRTITPGPQGGANRARRGADLLGFDLEKLTRENCAECQPASVYVVIGYANDATGLSRRTGTPTGAVWDADIQYCPALFAEWDDRSIAEQMEAWRDLRLPEPSIIVLTGGKSVHCYWVLDQPMPPDEWRVLQSRLIAYCGSDPKCKNPSRVMRLPGFAYIDKKTGKPTGGRCELIHTSDNRYTPGEIETCLSAPQAGSAFQFKQPLSDLPPRSLEEIIEAAKFIPERVVNGNTYETCRRALCGCSAALAEIGFSKENADEKALDLLGHKWPCREDAAQVLGSSTTRNSASFWAIAGVHGYDLRRDNSRQAEDASGIDQAADALKSAIEDGLSGSQLQTLIAELSTRFNLQVFQLREIYKELQREQDQRDQLKREGLQLQEQLSRSPEESALSFERLFPERLAKALRIQSEHLPYDDRSVAMAFMAGISGVLRLGTEICAHPLTGFVAPGNLFVITVGRSGQKKTALMNVFVIGPLSLIVERMERNNEAKEEKWREESRGKKKDERPPKPRKLYPVIQKYTAEALASQLQAHEKEELGLLICRDEISGLFAGFNQYKGGIGDDLQQLLEAYDGGGSTELRASTEDRHYPKCHVSVYGNIQPDVLDSLVKDGGVNDADGKWARAFFSPLPQIAKRLPATFTPEQEEAYVEAGALLKSIALKLHSLPPARYSLDSAARARFVEYELLKQQQAHAATHKAHASLYGKSAGKVVRLSLLIFLLRRTEEPSLGRKFSGYCIDVESLNRAIELVDSLDAWALSRHELIAASESKESGRLRLIHGIAEGKGGWVSWKEVRQSINSNKRNQLQCTAMTFHDAIRELVELGVGEIQYSGARGAVRYRATRSLPGGD